MHIKKETEETYLGTAERKTPPSSTRRAHRTRDALTCIESGNRYTKHT